MNRVSLAMQRLATRLETVAGETLHYAKGNEQPVKLTGWRGAQGPDPGQGEVPVDSEDDDFLFRVEEIQKLSGLPDMGDTITDQAGRTYQLRADGFDRYWRFSDQTQQIIRVHTQLD